MCRHYGALDRQERIVGYLHARFRQVFYGFLFSVKFLTTDTSKSVFSLVYMPIVYFF